MINLIQRFFPDRKGMEMWQLVLIVLAILFLVFMLSWYYLDLGEGIKQLLRRVLNFF
ncbi:MAG TPA: hypothetical protein VJC39_00315 [Candidatus Nanoarchaeia archaeon]|nr:hypothetical protein [Candidatus Nanoarchaeia archaeon]